MKLHNDFVANGYGVAAITSSEDLLSIYSPAIDQRAEDKVRLVFGVGTGLGVCVLVRPNESSRFQAFPSEAGLVKRQLYNKQDKEFFKFLREKGYDQTCDGNREDVSMILGGCALPWLAEFYAKCSESKEDFKSNSQLF